MAKIPVKVESRIKEALKRYGGAFFATRRSGLRILCSVMALLVWTSNAVAASKLPSLARVLAAVEQSGYESRPEQIPATVIDNGVLANVPYLSFRIGEDREVNVYGDPSDPACIEIGLYRSHLTSEPEKKLCLALANLLMPSLQISSLKSTGGKLLSTGIVAEVTMPDAPDAYGGWWISIYSLEKLNLAKGTGGNISTVSLTREEAVAVNEWTSAELSRARAPVLSQSAAAQTAPSRSYASSRSYTGSRVYVRSYVRKDGTYVRSHSRRR